MSNVAELAKVFEVTTKTTFLVENLEGTEAYKLATGLIVPRPIGWIGTVGESGVPNLAPFSFFNCIAGKPPMFAFSVGKGSRKDTLDNVKATGEFTINVVSEALADAMNLSSATVDASVDEFELAGLTAVPSDKISVPMVGECKANIECVVTNLVEVGDPTDGNVLVIGEGLVFHVQDDLLDGTRVDQHALGAVGRHVGNLYSRSVDLFEIERPR